MGILPGLLQIDSQAHAGGHWVVVAIQKERSSVVAKFKSARARSAAAAALPRTAAAAVAAALAAEGELQFGSANPGAGSGFFVTAGAAPTEAPAVEPVALTMEAGDAEEPQAVGTLAGTSVAQGEVEGSGGAEMEDEAGKGA